MPRSPCLLMQQPCWKRVKTESQRQVAQMIEKLNVWLASRGAILCFPMRAFVLLTPANWSGNVILPKP